MKTTGVRNVTLEMRLDELGEYARATGEGLVLLRQNGLDLKRNAQELRDDRKIRRNLLSIRAIERDHGKLIYARNCLQARLELLDSDNEQLWQDLGLRT